MSDNNNHNIDAEISEQVKKEIIALGDNVKANFEQINKGYAELKKTLETQNADDTLIKLKVDRLAADMSTRQEDIDKKFATTQAENIKRMNQLETMIKRPHFSIDDVDDKQLMQAAREFFIHTRSVKNTEERGVNLDDIDVNVDQYREYHKNFIKFLRSPGSERNMTPEMFKALSVGVDPDGGYTVSPYLSNRVVEQMYEMDPIRQLSSVESITTNALEFMVDRGQAGAGWEAETAAGAETTTPDFGKKRISVNIMYAKPRATQQLLEDSGINIEA